MNPYEQAIFRCENATENLRRAKELSKKSIQDAEAEYDDAYVNLRTYESKPGTPLPEYRHWDTLSGEDRILYTQFHDRYSAEEIQQMDEYEHLRPDRILDRHARLIDEATVEE